MNFHWDRESDQSFTEKILHFIRLDKNRLKKYFRKEKNKIGNKVYLNTDIFKDYAELNRICEMLLADTTMKNEHLSVKLFYLNNPDIANPTPEFLKQNSEQKQAFVHSMFFEILGDIPNLRSNTSIHFHVNKIVTELYQNDPFDSRLSTIHDYFGNEWLNNSTRSPSITSMIDHLFLTNRINESKSLLREINSRVNFKNQYTGPSHFFKIIKENNSGQNKFNRTKLKTVTFTKKGQLGTSKQVDFTKSNIKVLRFINRNLPELDTLSIEFPMLDEEVSAISNLFQYDLDTIPSFIGKKKNDHSSVIIILLNDSLGNERFFQLQDYSSKYRDFSRDVEKLEKLIRNNVLLSGVGSYKNQKYYLVLKNRLNHVDDIQDKIALADSILTLVNNNSSSPGLLSTKINGKNNFDLLQIEITNLKKTIPQEIFETLDYYYIKKQVFNHFGIDYHEYFPKGKPPFNPFGGMPMIGISPPKKQTHEEIIKNLELWKNMQRFKSDYAHSPINQLIKSYEIFLLLDTTKIDSIYSDYINSKNEASKNEIGTLLSCYYFHYGKIEKTFNILNIMKLPVHNLNYLHTIYTLGRMLINFNKIKIEPSNVFDLVNQILDEYEYWLQFDIPREKSIYFPYRSIPIGNDYYRLDRIMANRMAKRRELWDAYVERRLSLPKNTITRERLYLFYEKPQTPMRPPPPPPNRKEKIRN